MPSVDSNRSKRTDAVRNRERLLSAARQAFAAKGPDVALEEVARIAEVSRTTLYRNFTTREELAAMVFEDNVARIEQLASDLAGRPDGIIKLFEDVLDMIIDERSFVHVLSGADIEWFTALSRRTAAAFESLLAAGRSAGLVVDGVGAEDLMIALHMARPLAERVEGDAAESVRIGRAILHRALFVHV
ncbi:TetR/AcrR family transcriptional regulator [Rhodococcoides kyotonense]|nr:TetR/AcrR family transcriptional regulator [Rhodococcus kyotonensis]